MTAPTPTQTVLCGTCFCIVPAENYTDHSEWHTSTRTWLS